MNLVDLLHTVHNINIYIYIYIYAIHIYIYIYVYIYILFQPLASISVLQQKFVFFFYVNVLPRRKRSGKFLCKKKTLRKRSDCLCKKNST